MVSELLICRAATDGAAGKVALDGAFDLQEDAWHAARAGREPL